MFFKNFSGIWIIKEIDPGDLLLGGKKYDTFISDSAFVLSLSFGSISVTDRNTIVNVTEILGPKKLL